MKQANEFGSAGVNMARRRAVLADAVGLTRWLCVMPPGLVGLRVWRSTMLDVLSGMDSIQICTAYELEGQRSCHFPSHAQELSRVRPVYESLPGFDVDISSCTSIEQLPSAARRYLDRIASLVGVPIEFVSVGPDRRQTIDCDEPHWV